MSVSLPSIPGWPHAATWLRWGCFAVVGGGVAGALASEFAAAAVTQPQLGLEPVAYLIGLTAVLVVGLFSRTHPLLSAGFALGLVVLIHFLGFPGGGAGLALFASVFELGRIGRRPTLIAAAATPVAWALLLAPPPHAVSLASPALLGPAAAMLWTAATGYAFGRIQWKPNTVDTRHARYRTPVGEGLMALLTRREREIAELVATGLDNTAIAQRLYISPVTVKSHVAHIMAKTNTTTRAQLVAQILQRRIPA